MCFSCICLLLFFFACVSFLSFFSSSWCHGLAAAFDCGTPWTFLCFFFFFFFWRAYCDTNIILRNMHRPQPDNRTTTVDY